MPYSKLFSRFFSLILFRHNDEGTINLEIKDIKAKFDNCEVSMKETDWWITKVDD